jgi:hypothetical protein
MILKKHINNTARILMNIPKRPNVNGPCGIYVLLVKMLGKKARTNDVELKIIKEPTKSWNAVLLPRGIAPRPVPKRAQNKVAGIGQLSFSLTMEKNCAKGVALSRAKVHQIREMVKTVPIVQIMRERKIINRRPKVAPLLLLVACAYTSARGKEPLLFRTASRSEMPYKMAIA